MKAQNVMSRLLFFSSSLRVIALNVLISFIKRRCIPHKFLLGYDTNLSVFREVTANKLAQLSYQSRRLNLVKWQFTCKFNFLA